MFPWDVKLAPQHDRNRDELRRLIEPLLPYLDDPTGDGDTLLVAFEADPAGEAARAEARAQTHLVAGAPQPALVWAQTAGALALHAGDARRAATSHRVAAQALWVLGRHADALVTFDAARASAKQAGDARHAAQVQIGRIESLNFLGRYDEAHALAHRLTAVLLTENAPIDATKVLVNEGNLYFRRDCYAQALACYEKAEPIFAAQTDALTLARVQANRANLLIHLGRVEEAIGLAETARDAFGASGAVLEAAMTNANIGFLHYLSGRYGAALSAYARARESFAALSHAELERAKCDADRTDVYHALNLVPEALSAYGLAMREFDRLSLPYERARAALGYAAALIAANQEGEAERVLAEAERAFKVQRNAAWRAQVLLIRAYALRGRSGDNPEAANELFTLAGRAARGLNRAHLRGLAADARFLQAGYALEREAGTPTMRRRRMQSVLRDAQTLGRGWLETQARRALGRDDLRRGKIASALRHFRAGVDALESVRTQIAPEEMHIAFMDDKLAIYEDLVEALLRRGSPVDRAEALETVERAKSRLLLERIQAAAAPASAGDAATTRLAFNDAARERLAVLRAELSHGYRRAQFGDDNAEVSPDDDQRRRWASAGMQTGDSLDLRALEKAYAETLREAELAAISGRDQRLGVAVAAVDAPTFAVGDWQSALKPGEIVVEYYIAGGEVSAFALTRTRLLVFRNIATEREVEAVFQRLRYQLQKAATLPKAYTLRHARTLEAGATETFACLFRLLLAPLSGIMDEAEKITIIPHGVLHALPFHAFVDENGAAALDKHEFTYAPSMALWRAGRQRDSEKRRVNSATATARSVSGSRGDGALLMGVPDPSLVFVAREIAEISRLLPGATVRENDAATLGAFRENAPQSRIIHLATHALFREDNALFSGLRFAGDERLLARDLYEIDLHGADLVTLSACQTGASAVASGDELFGLVRGFLAAGARTVAASLWPADDAATADLMSRFYARLVSPDGSDKAVTVSAALRGAQQETRNRYPHPYYWAAFALFGDGA